jgi:hypothetical protein
LNRRVKNEIRTRSETISKKEKKKNKLQLYLSDSANMFATVHSYVSQKTFVETPAKLPTRPSNILKTSTFVTSDATYENTDRTVQSAQPLKLASSASIQTAPDVYLDVAANSEPPPDMGYQTGIRPGHQ